MIKYYVNFMVLGIILFSISSEAEALSPLIAKGADHSIPSAPLDHLKPRALPHPLFQKSLSTEQAPLLASVKKTRAIPAFPTKGRSSQKPMEVVESIPDHLNPPFLTNLSYLPVKKYEVGSMVSAVSIRSRSFLGEFSTDFKAALFGGSLKGYAEMMGLAFKDAEEQLRVEARLQGATHVIGVQMTSGMTLSNDIWVRAQGTAVRVTDSTPVPVFMENPAKLEILQTPPPQKVDDAIMGNTPQEEKANLLESLIQLKTPL